MQKANNKLEQNDVCIGSLMERLRKSGTDFSPV